MLCRRLPRLLLRYCVILPSHHGARRGEERKIRPVTKVARAEMIETSILLSLAVGACASIGHERAREAMQLKAAAAAAVAGLPAGHAARDDLRALQNKLVSLLDVGAVTAPAEWDASLQALLDANYYGVDDLAALLKKHMLNADAGDQACDDDEHVHPGRQLQQQVQQAAIGAPQPQPPSATPQPQPPNASPQAHTPSATPQAHTPSAMPQAHPPSATPHTPWNAQGTTPPLPPRGSGNSRPAGCSDPVPAAALDSFESGVEGYAWDLRATLEAWRAWALDRPPPWERDCDCCFPRCPQGCAPSRPRCVARSPRHARASPRHARATPVPARATPAPRPRHARATLFACPAPVFVSPASPT